MFGINLSPEAANALLIAAYLVGVAGRILWPYIIAYVTEPQAFDWNMAKGQMIAAAVGLAGIVFQAMTKADFMTTLGALGYAGAIIAGYGLASVGRETQKTVALRGQ